MLTLSRAICKISVCRHYVVVPLFCSDNKYVLRSRFDFSFNVCEPIDDANFAGNTYPGVRYYLKGSDADVPAGQQVRAIDEWHAWFTDVEESTIEAEDPMTAAATAPESVDLEAAPPAVSDLVGVIAHVAGLQQADLERADLDSVSLRCMSEAPFGLGHYGFGMEGWPENYGPQLSRMLNWLGLRYHIAYGNKAREAVKAIKGWLSQGHIPIVPAGDRSRWGLVDGYRPDRHGEGAEFRVIAADTSRWTRLSRDWRGYMPGRVSVQGPVVVVERAGEVVPAAALVDSMAAIAVQMALRKQVLDEPSTWGNRAADAGLAAWDRWVVDWERRPWTPDWARIDWIRNRLNDLRDGQYLDGLAGDKRLAAAFFANRARREGDADRKALLREVSEAYTEVAEIAVGLKELMPEEGAGEETEADAERLNHIGRAKPKLRLARDAERRAITALRQLLGQPPLAAAAEDPLARKNQGHLVLSWGSDLSRGVYDIALQATDVRQRYVAGREAEGIRWNSQGAVPAAAGWLLEIETLNGAGIYQVIRQPTAANDWTAVVRLNDRSNWPEVPTEVVVCGKE